MNKGIDKKDCSNALSIVCQDKQGASNDTECKRCLILQTSPSCKIGRNHLFTSSFFDESLSRSAAVSSDTLKPIVASIGLPGFVARQVPLHFLYLKSPVEEGVVNLDFS